jgi:hypothetical protein
LGATSGQQRGGEQSFADHWAFSWLATGNLTGPLRQAVGDLKATVGRARRSTGNMSRTKWFLHRGRVLEVRDLRVMTSLEIWIYENDRPLGRHGVLALREAVAGFAQGHDLLGDAMDGAVADVEAGLFSLDPAPPVLAAD